MLQHLQKLLKQRFCIVKPYPDSHSSELFDSFASLLRKLKVGDL